MSKVELKSTTKFSALTKITERLAKLKNMKVGVLKGTGEHPNAEHGQTVSQIAWWNEFGTEITFGRSGGSRILVPARPFLRPTMRENRAKFVKVMARILESALKGNGDPRKKVIALGMLAQSLIVQAIDNTISPPNAPSTLAAKFPKTHPLINTGRLRQSISFAEDK